MGSYQFRLSYRWSLIRYMILQVPGYRVPWFNPFRCGYYQVFRRLMAIMLAMDTGAVVPVWSSVGEVSEPVNTFGTVYVQQRFAVLTAALDYLDYAVTIKILCGNKVINSRMTAYWWSYGHYCHISVIIVLYCIRHVCPWHSQREERIINNIYIDIYDIRVKLGLFGAREGPKQS